VGVGGGCVGRGCGWGVHLIVVLCYCCYLQVSQLFAILLSLHLVTFITGLDQYNIYICFSLIHIPVLCVPCVDSYALYSEIHTAPCVALWFVT